ncbi:hypothetical protein HQ585_01575 [candidate division KSB1 bacterium]|nr:hypothetical protein [candidate division KSB1 bacterium]
MIYKKNQRSIRPLAFLLIFILLGFGLTPVLAGETEGGDSPQKVFDAAKAAGAKKDFNILAKLVAPSERPMLAFGTDMGVGMFVEFYEGEKADELKKKYQKIQDKYGVKDVVEDDSEKLQITEQTTDEEMDAHMRKRAIKRFGHVDVVNYVPDLMAIVLKMPEMADQPFFPYKKLSGLKIDGDKATGKAGEDTITFIKEGGRWYLTADTMD